MTYEMVAHKPGHYPLERLPYGWENAKVALQSKPEKPRFEIIDLKNKDRYYQEPMCLIAIKCFFIASVGLPIYTSVYTSLHILRFFTAPLYNCSIRVLCNELWTVVRIPFYFLTLELSALYGILFPLDGRAFFGKIERAFHGEKMRGRSCVHQKEKPSFSKSLFELLTEKDPAQTCFLAYCFQPVGKTTDERILTPEIQNSLGA